MGLYLHLAIMLVQLSCQRYNFSLMKKIFPMSYVLWNQDLHDLPLSPHNSVRVFYFANYNQCHSGEHWNTGPAQEQFIQQFRQFILLVPGGQVS